MREIRSQHGVGSFVVNERERKKNSLDQHTLSTFQCSIDIRHRSRETFSDQIGLTMRPREFQVVHGRSAGRNMGRVKRGVRVRYGCAQVRGGHEGASWLLAG